jgi:NAD(P)-dependent dehydrogenase (short-subunit alcohol dehydrogenase family)
LSASLKDQRVLVIGRESGIARAIALAAHDNGANVVVASRDAEALAKAYNDPAITTETVDLTDEPSIASLADRLGHVDHVVSTASARARGEVGNLTQETIMTSFSTKVVGPMLLAKHFAPRMPKDGSFVFMSGSTALKPAIGMLAVGATNGAVDVITRSLSVELAPIRVNAISPGTIDTGAYDALGEQKKAELYAMRSEHNPARRIGTPDDVAEAAMFALTTTFMTGVSIGIDGGEPLV